MPLTTSTPGAFATDQALQQRHVVHVASHRAAKSAYDSMLAEIEDSDEEGDIRRATGHAEAKEVETYHRRARHSVQHRHVVNEHDAKEDEQLDHGEDEAEEFEEKNEQEQEAQTRHHQHSSTKRGQSSGASFKEADPPPASATSGRWGFPKHKPPGNTASTSHPLRTKGHHDIAIHEHSSESNSKNSEDDKVESPVKHPPRDAFGASSAMTHGTANGSSAASRADYGMLRSFLMQPVKPSDQALRCFVERDKSGFHRLNPVYRLFLEDDRHFLMSAQKRVNAKTSLYLLTMDMSPSDRKTDLTVSKLRANWSGSEYTIYDNGLNPTKTALEANVRNVLGVVEFSYDAMGPGKMNVYIPRVTEHSGCSKWRDLDADKKESAFMVKERLQKDSAVLHNKRPQYDTKTGGHVLNFHGRITMPSVKNFQLECESQGDDTILQFGRVSCQPPGPRSQCKCHQDIFNMDVKYPLSPLQAFAICLSSLDNKIAGQKMYDSVSRLIKKKS